MDVWALVRIGRGLVCLVRIRVGMLSYIVRWDLKVWYQGIGSFGCLFLDAGFFGSLFESLDGMVFLIWCCLVTPKDVSSQKEQKF